MTIYNSQRVNTDPMPWTGYDGRRKFRHSRFACLNQPRPEYDNNLNRMLEVFRGDIIYYDFQARKAAGSWLEAWDAITLYWSEDYKLKPSEVEHALKVLTKLVNVYKE